MQEAINLEPNFTLVQSINISCRTQDRTPVGGVIIGKFLENLFEAKEKEIEANLGAWIEKLLDKKIFS